MVFQLHLRKDILTIHQLKMYVMYVLAVGMLLIMTACNASPPPTSENVTSQRTPKSDSPEDSNVASSEKQPDNTEAKPTVSDGKCDNVKVGKKVKELVLTCEAIQVIATAEHVQSFTVEPYPALPDDKSMTEDKKIGSYPIEAESRKLTAKEKMTLQDLIFSDSHYVFSDAQKRCLFQPKIAFRFSKGAKKLDVLISFGCEMWRFVSKNDGKTFDFRHVTKQALVKLRDAVFPIPETQVEPSNPEKTDSEKTDSQDTPSEQTETGETEASKLEKPGATGSATQNQ